MPTLQLFGGATLDGGSGPVLGPAAQRHRLALLALLALAQPRGVTRDRLIGCLWPERDAESARHLLKQSVYVLRRTLGEAVIVTSGDELRLDTGVVRSDVVEFEAALAAGEAERAVGLYAGAFLDGFFLSDSTEFEGWAARERDRLARRQAAALESLAVAAEREGEFSQAAAWWYRLAAHDPLSPRIAVRLMRALDAAGERGAALQHARVFESLFRQELDAPVDEEVAALAARLRSAPDPPPPAAEPAPPPAPPAPVRSAAPTPRADGAADRPARVGGGRGRARRLALLLAALVVAAGWLLQRRGPASAIEMPAVAVLPFADHSPGRDHDYFAAGVMEEVAGALARVPGLRVVAPTAAPGGDLDVQRVGQRLGVQTVLQGSVSRWGDSVRINAKLVRVSDRAYLWSETYISPMGSIFAIQDSISRAIGATLVERLIGPRRADREPGTAELEAYNLYLRGRYAWHRRTQESLAGAVAHFERAIAIAPGYARAHAGLADAYAVQGFYDYRPPQEAFSKAETAARHALTLDASLAQPHATIGYVQLYYHWNWADAERAFARAIELDPAYSTAHQWQANYLTAMGRSAEAERAMRRAMELDPLSLIANAALGWVHYMATDYERAIEQCTRTLELEPGFKQAYYWLALAHERAGRPEEAVRLLERALELSPGSAITVAALAYAHATAGRPERARALLHELHAVEERYIPPYEVAKAHLALGERDAALEWLERAYEQRSHSMAFLRVDPQLAPLQDDPRFRALLRRVGHRG